MRISQGANERSDAPFTLHVAWRVRESGRDGRSSWADRPTNPPGAVLNSAQHWSAGVDGRTPGIESIAVAMVYDGSAQTRSPARPAPEQDRLLRPNQWPQNYSKALHDTTNLSIRFRLQTICRLRTYGPLFCIWWEIPD